MQNVTLIGKGLVSKHLLKLLGDRVVAQYDSKNIDSLSHRDHELVICAAPSAKKWIANQNPEVDIKSCHSLVDNIRMARMKNLILISTVDVYSSTSTVPGEDSFQYSSDPYGKNRRMIEESLSSSVPCSIVRLPALFGEHLEKNYVFDLLNDNNLSKIKVKSSFQWLDLRRIEECLAISQVHSVVNYVVEPVSTLEIVEKFFPRKLELLDLCSEGLNYNVKSNYASNGYFHKKEQVIRDMEIFFDWYHNCRSNWS